MSIQPVAVKQTFINTPTVTQPVTRVSGKNWVKPVVYATLATLGIGLAAYAAHRYYFSIPNNVNPGNDPIDNSAISNQQVGSNGTDPIDNSAISHQQVGSNGTDPIDNSAISHQQVGSNGTDPIDNSAISHQQVGSNGTDPIDNSAISHQQVGSNATNPIDNSAISHQQVGSNATDPNASTNPHQLEFVVSDAPCFNTGVQICQASSTTTPHLSHNTQNLLQHWGRSLASLQPDSATTKAKWEAEGQSPAFLKGQCPADLKAFLKDPNHRAYFGAWPKPDALQELYGDHPLSDLETRKLYHAIDSAVPKPEELDASEEPIKIALGASDLRASARTYTRERMKDWWKIYFFQAYDWLRHGTTTFDADWALNKYGTKNITATAFEILGGAGRTNKAVNAYVNNL